jgi:hypothetical protein
LDLPSPELDVVAEESFPLDCVFAPDELEDFTDSLLDLPLLELDDFTESSPDLLLPELEMAAAESFPLDGVFAPDELDDLTDSPLDLPLFELDELMAVSFSNGDTSSASSVGPPTTLLSSEPEHAIIKMAMAAAPKNLFIIFLISFPLSSFQTNS